MNDNDFGVVFNENLKRLLRINGKTASDMAEDLNIARSTIGSWQSKNIAPRMDTIDKLCEYFHVSREEMLYKNGEEDLESKRVRDLSKDLVKRVNILRIANKLNKLTDKQIEKIERIIDDLIFWLGDESNG